MELTYEKGLIGGFGIDQEMELSEQILIAGFQAADIDFKFHMMELVPDKLAEAVASARLLNMHGFQLAEPFQEKVIDHLDQISPVARVTNRVNVVANHDGEMVGENTQAKGLGSALMFRDILPQNHVFAIEGKDDLALAAVAELSISGAERIELYTDDRESAEKVIEKLDTCTEIHWNMWTESIDIKEDVDIFVRTGHDSLKIQGLKPASIVCDMNLFYDDHAFLEEMRSCGMELIEGKEIFFHKIHLHYCLWTQHFMENEPMMEALDRGLGEKMKQQDPPEYNEEKAQILADSLRELSHGMTGNSEEEKADIFWDILEKAGVDEILIDRVIYLVFH